MSLISSAGYNAATSAASAWLQSAQASIAAQKTEGGLIGMLKNSGGDGSISSYLSQSSLNANAFALISQNGVTNAGSLVAQLASQNLQKQNEKQLEKVMKDLEAAKSQVQPKNVLDSVIYFSDGSTLDTAGNILTMVDGTQYDTTTGARYVDPAAIIQMANGAYLDTMNNILTMPDGTRIDTVTGLMIAVTA